MSGALKAGSVYVAVSAAIGEFTKTMSGVVKSVEQTAARVKAAAAPLAEVGRLFAAGMAGAVLASAASNGRIARDVERLKSQLYTLAADIGDAFGPFVRQLTHAVSSLVGSFQRLSPAAKESLAKFVLFMASMGAGATVLGKTAGLVEGVAKVASGLLVPALGAASSAAKLLGEAGGAAFPALGKAVASMEGGILQSVAKMAVGFASVLIPIAAVAAAVAGVVLLAGTLYEAWSESSTGLKDSLLSVWESLKDLGRKLTETLTGWWETLKSVLLLQVRGVLDAIALVVAGTAKNFATLARAVGLTGIAGTLEELQNLTGDKLLKGLQEGASFLADKATSAAQALANGGIRVGKEIAEGVSYGLGYSLKGVRKIASDTGLDTLPERLRAALSGVLGGAAGKVRAPRNKAAEEKRKQFEKEMDALQAQAQEESRQEYIRSIRADEASGAAYFKALAEDAKKFAEETAKTVKDARDALTSRFKNAFGDLAELVDTFQQGMQAGGVWGGVIAVIADLLTRSQQFAKFLDVLSGIIGMVADAVGQFVQPFIPLVGAIGQVIGIMSQTLKPAFDALNQFIQPLIPPIVLLGDLLQGLTPILQLVGQAFFLIHTPLEMLGGPIMKALFEVLKWVAKAILFIVKGIAAVWNGIIGAIQAVLRAIGGFSIAGAKPFGFLEKWADGLNSAKINTDAMSEALTNLNNTTWDSAQAQAAQTAETLANYRATKKANEALSNVPSAFKIALRRFESQDAQTTFTEAGGTGVPVPTSSGAWGSGTASPYDPTGAGPGRPPPGVGTGPNSVASTGAAVQIGSIQINTTNAAESADQLERALDRAAYRMTGSRGRAGRWAVQLGE